MVDMTATRRAALASLLAATACGAVGVATPSGTGASADAATSGAVAEPTEAPRPAEVTGGVPAAARFTDYGIDAHLGAEQHQVRGAVRITWRNRSGREVTSLPLHLYMSSFRADDTAWMLESRGSHRGVRQGNEGMWGYIDLG